MAEKFVGQSVKRTEDPRLIQGLAHYVDDIKLPDTLHAVFLRSIYAHARIKKIDTTAAAKLPGVVAVYTGKDVSQKIGPVPCGAAIPDMKTPDHRVLATDKVYWVGHPVAMVVAENKYIARDAVDLIEIDYDELPSVLDEEKAADPKSPVIHEKFGNNIAYKRPHLLRHAHELEQGRWESWVNDKIRADGVLKDFVKERYSSWDTGIGQEIEAGASFADLEKYILEKGDASLNVSGRQEMLENIVNRYIR